MDSTFLRHRAVCAATARLCNLSHAACYDNRTDNDDDDENLRIIVVPNKCINAMPVKHALLS